MRARALLHNAGAPAMADGGGAAAQRAHEGETAMAVMQGTIKRLVRDKGFGFIATGGDQEFFFHSSACSGARFDDLREGQAVSFEEGRGPKGPRAENVRAE
jgi:cold shock protein